MTQTAAREFDTGNWYSLASLAIDWGVGADEIMRLERDGKLDLHLISVTDAERQRRRQLIQVEHGATEAESNEESHRFNSPGNFGPPSEETQHSVGILRHERDKFEQEEAAMTDSLWTTWSNRKLWPLDNAVLLLHEINPDSKRARIYKAAFGIDGFGAKEMLSPYQKDVLWDTGAKIEETWATVNAADLGNEIHCVPRRGLSSRGFLVWAKDNGFNIPEPLRPMLSTQQDANGAAEPLHATERETLLKLVLGMAINAYGYDPAAERNTATGEKAGSIAVALQGLGLTVDPDTIRKTVKRAAERFPTVSKPAETLKR